MARVTVEDCIDKVESPYELVLVAKERTTQLNSGVEPTVSIDNDKNTVISLREIAKENVKVEMISKGISKINISLIINNFNLEKSLLMLHKALFA